MYTNGCFHIQKTRGGWGEACTVGQYKGSGTDELFQKSQQQFRHLCGAGGAPINFDEVLIV